MDTLTALGTGYAVATRCFTTCFALSDGAETLLLDTGGGNGLLTNLERAGIDLASIRHVFISHRHTDHILGVPWLVRMAAQRLSRDEAGSLTIYCDPELTEGLMAMCAFMLPKRLAGELGRRIIFQGVADGETLMAGGWPLTFFDTGSIKDRQLGVSIVTKEGRRLVYLGDEPLRAAGEPYARGADYLLHEAMCLYAESEQYQPQRIAHSSVKEACANASRMEARALLLFHTEDRQLAVRKERYTAEARRFYDGSIYVPDDLDVIGLVSL